MDTSSIEILRAERLIIVNLVQSLLHNVHSGMFKDEGFAAACALIVLGNEVTLAQAKDQPTSIPKLADILQVSRTRIEPRVRTLEELGYVKHERRRLLVDTGLVADHAAVTLERSCQFLIEAYIALMKLRR